MNENEDKIRFVALSMEELPAFRVPDDVIEALSATADELKARADVLLEKLSDITHDKHLPGTSWKENLSAKATVAEIQLAAGVHLDNDVSGLPALLSELIEAEYAGAVTLTRLYFGTNEFLDYQSPV